VMTLLLPTVAKKYSQVLAATCGYILSVRKITIIGFARTIERLPLPNQ